MTEIVNIQKIAENAALEAGAYIKEHIGRISSIAHKGGINDLVTDVDKASEAMITKAVMNAYPDHSILAEESGKKDGISGITWIIDPLDGTTNFAHAFPVFCVSIGVVNGDEYIAGVIYDPNRDELFSAINGAGATLNGEKISVSGSDHLKRSLIATGFPYDFDDKVDNLKYFRSMLQIAQAVRRPGAAALDLAYVACGRLDGFWELGLSPWDMAAGKLLVEEAGGKVSGMFDDSFDIMSREIVASNGTIHKQMQDLLSRS